MPSPAWAGGGPLIRLSRRGRTDRKPFCFLVGAVALLGALAGRPGGADEPPAPGAPFRFHDVTVETGLEKYVRGALNHAVAWGDVEGDGRLDLFLGNFADRPNQPWRFCEGMTT